MKQIDDITWQSNDGLITFKNMDCNEFMAGCKDNEFNLNLSDPPYGIGISGQKECKKGKKSDRKFHMQKSWDLNIPDKQTFENIFSTSKNQVLWGANYIVEHLKEAHKGWIIWDKMQHGLTMSDCEIAYSSFDYPTRVWYKNRCVLKEQETIHPTEKPIELYKWILDNYTKPTDTILDCFGGSMSNAIACHMKRRKLTII